MHAVVVRRELLSSRHPSNIPPFCKIGGQNRKIQCALINQGFSQKATSKTLKILTFLCLFSSPERRSIRRCTEFHLKLKIRWANTPCGFDPRHRHHTKARKPVDDGLAGFFLCFALLWHCRRGIKPLRQPAARPYLISDSFHPGRHEAGLYYQSAALGA